MPGLYSRLQEIIGEKIFRHKVVFDGAVECKGDVVHKKHITGYAPVAGEPSCGTPHLHPGTILSTDPAVTTLQTLDISPYVPVGTKLVRGWGTFVSATAGRTLQLEDSTDTYVYSKAYTLAAATTSFTWACAVDANRNIYWKVSNADVSALVLYLVEYYP